MKFTPAFAAIVVALVNSGPVHAWFRVACGEPIVSERVDPIISPNTVPSNHVHTVHGASNFKANSTYDTLRGSKCTSCQVTQDLSNYWFPKLYFQDPKTKNFEAVPNGGLLVYYQNRGSGDVRNGGTGLKAFPPGFRMISGDPTRRSKKYQAGEGSQAELAERAIQWVCLRYTTPNPDVYNDDGMLGFPTTDCEAGFNARISMPACWDGKNLDSPDHKSHVAFLSILDNGNCPSTHPVYMMKLFYEITWDVHTFAGRWNPGVDKWPFVYATGDPTGYSWHGDFQNGWDTTVLQNAIDHCNNPNDETNNGVTAACPYFNLQSAATGNTCKTTSAVNENVGSGVLTKLPGCNPIQPGPGAATIYSDSNCPIH